MPRIQASTSQAILSALCLSLAYGGCLPETTCKAYPGSPDWPSQSVWSQLNDTVTGRLLTPTPPGAACHKGWPTYDESQCAEVATNWTVYEFHCEDPVSVMWDQYANDTCLPNPEFPCSAGGYPAYVINATTPGHVKAGIDFARQHNIRLVVKNTGHDYIGRSVAPGALSIWTHHMNKIAIHDDGFKLDGSDTKIPGMAVTVGAGAQMWDIYAATDAVNQTIVGGGGKSVGIGGYITGGGHSILSPRYGLAADQVLQMEMVTPSGQIITINENQNSDLFWAMRGGGGSTFGVLTSITLQTHPTPKIMGSSWILATDANAPIAPELLSFALSLYPSLEKAGLSGYGFATTRLPNPVPIPGAPEEVAGIMASFILQDSDNPEDLDNIWNPINETVQKRWSGAAQLIHRADKYDSFLDWFKDHYDQGAAGNDSYLVSRLIDEEALNSEHLVDAIASAAGPESGIAVFLVSGMGVHENKPRGGGNAVNPAWRRSYVHSITGRQFPPFNATAKQEAIKILNEAFQPLRELTPNTGAYINEALPFEPDWQHTFWGDNYERLLSIKKQVDPLDVLWCVPCVGNEGWQQLEDGRLCRVD